MDRRSEGDLDVLLRHVGEWLLVGYTVAMVLVTFVMPEQRSDRVEHSSSSASRAASGFCREHLPGRVQETGAEAAE